MPPCTIQVHVNRLATQNRMDKITKSEEKKHIEISYNKTRYKLHVIISISCTSFLKTNHIKIQLKCFTTANQILRFIKFIELHDQIIYRIVVSKTTPTPWKQIVSNLVVCTFTNNKLILQFALSQTIYKALYMYYVIHWETVILISNAVPNCKNE